MKRTSLPLLARRRFIAGLGATATWPLVARAQQGGPTRVVAVLTGGGGNVPILKSELEKLGWIEGRNIRFEPRYGIADPESIQTFARELVDLSPDVILASTTPALAAFRQLTSSIPIVFVNVSDPVNQGFVSSLARPGGNITGFSNFEYAISTKWLEMLKEVAPSMTRAGIVLGHNDPSWTRYLAPIEAAAPALDIQLSTILLEERAAIEHATDVFARQPHGGLVLLPNARVLGRDLGFFAQLAARLRLPTIYYDRRFPAGGGLMSYGISLDDLFRRAAPYVDRILRGEKPADLPVQAPTKFELVINLKAAKALGLTVPNSLLALADEVIE